MSYNPLTDFLGLLRQTSGGVRSESMPGLDFVVSAMARAGLITLKVQAVAPTTNQAATAWFKPAVPSWSNEGILYLWNGNTNAYEPATVALWSAYLATPGTAQIVQDVTTPGPANVLINAGVVRVNQAVGAPITLVMPLSATKLGGVLISDWKGDATVNNITVNLSGGEKFPGGLSSWVIANNTGSIFLRPVVGGYAL